MRTYSTRVLLTLSVLCLGLQPALADGAGQTAKLLPGDGAMDDKLGESVAVSGTTAIVGVYQDDDNGIDSGSAYLYDTETGNLIAKLLPGDGAANAQFGRDVAISGDIAIVGAFGVANGGAAYLFNALTGIQIAKLTPNDGAAGHLFGFSVAIDGDTAVVGAIGDPGSFMGSAYLFDTNTGLQTAKLVPSDGADFDFFGLSAGISGSTAILGAFNHDDNGSDSGAAYLFDTNTGLEIAKLLPNDGAAGDLFGESVGISGNTAIVGAHGDDDNGLDSGSAYLFDASTGLQLAKLLPGDGAGGESFGWSVAISGTTSLAAAIADDDNGTDSGSAYLFEYPLQASVVERNGSGLNALILSRVTDPALGADWITDLDCSGHSPAAACFKVYSGASSGVTTVGGELLINLASPAYISVTQAHTGGVIQFSMPVPSNTALCGLSASVQGIVFGAPLFELSNALDIVIGL